MGKAWPREMQEEAVRRYMAGESAAALSRELGPSRQAILRWVREASPGASRPVPESLRRAQDRRPEDLGDGDAFWRRWEERQRELAAVEPAPAVETQEQAAETALSEDGAFRLSMLPLLLLGAGGGVLAKGVRDALRGGGRS